MTRLQYRGVSYDTADHVQPTSRPVDHVYRGRHYDAPLRHDPAPVDPSLDLHYRGHLYHHVPAGEPSGQA